jgi:DNA polymerase delta subunit 1
MKELIMLQTHIDFDQNLTSLDLTTPTITIYGNTIENIPVQVRVTDYLPYLYAQTSSKVPLDILEASIRASTTKGQCMGVETVMRQSIYGYSEEKTLFYKVYFNSQIALKSAKAFLENGIMVGKERAKFKVYESNFPLILRFMKDLKLSGMTYIKVKNYEVTSTCPFVITSGIDFIEQLPIENEYIKILPLKILSFDIECCGNNNSFPVPQKDPVIQIGNTVQRFGQEDSEKVIFCLKETANIPGATVHWFDNEVDMLIAWKDYLLETDPDILTGYNIKNFDFPYLIDRAEALKIKDYGRLGRTDRVSKVVNKAQSSKAFGSFDTKDIQIDGRIIFDMYHIIKRDYKLRSYSLNSVSVHFLNEQKEDVPYSSMYALQNGDKETRRRIASYCLRDTYLPVRIMDMLNIIINYCELSRATYVPIEYFLTRGSAIKVLSLIYREADALGFLVPDMDITDNDESFEGAFVMDPIKGYYSNPIAVLDFTSLYPSIMISKNLCYSTLMTKAQYEKIGGIVTPTNNYFCTPAHKEGVLPRIFKNLLRARKETKALLKETKDPLMRKSLDGRQLALKICANSIYGFTGAAVGQLPCIEISQSTTAFGREMIAETKRLIEDNFNKKMNYTHDAQVIYGDTDSVMINFKENDMKKVFQMALEISKFVSSKFEKPVSLEFEKVYNPYLLMNKKRYAGLIYTNPDRPDKIDTKGIETVRRDNCELVKVVIQTCLNKILYEKDVSGAMGYVKSVIKDLYTDNVDLSQLVISKSYTKNVYASKQAHVELAERLKKRGIHVGIGDRIAYVIVKGDKKMAAYEKSEDPVYVLEHNLPIDKEYYIEQQLSKPLHRLFEPILDNVSSLFNGQHTQVISKNVSVTGPLNAFIVANEECVGCKKVGKILCIECRKDFPRHYMALQRLLDEKSQRFHSCWTECQRCQGSIINEVLCVNRDCPIFYMRTKVKKEIVPLQEKIEKIRKLSW